MKYNYGSIQDELRKQTLINAEHISKHLYDFSLNHPYNISNNDVIHNRSTSLFCVKLISCLSFILLISCYIYGGQDIKKGFKLIYTDLNVSINELEETYPALSEVIGTCEKGYYYLIDKTKELQK